MSVFGNIKEVKVSKSGQYFKPGKYRVRINAVKLQYSQIGVNKQYFIVETEVLTSDNSDIPVGMECSQVVPMENVMALNNVKAFVGAASGVDPLSETINEEVEAYWKKTLVQQGILEEHEEADFTGICEFIVSPLNPLKGIEMDLECVNTVTQSGGDFTKHYWRARQV